MHINLLLRWYLHGYEFRFKHNGPIIPVTVPCLHKDNWHGLQCGAALLLSYLYLSHCETLMCFVATPCLAGPQPQVRGQWRGPPLKRHFWKACLNFGKARCLWYAEKLFWFIAKILEFDIYRSSASNEDFLESWWRRKCSILNFPPLEYVSDFEPGSHADQWQWS